MERGTSTAPASASTSSRWARHAWYTLVSFTLSSPLLEILVVVFMMVFPFME